MPRKKTAGTRLSRDLPKMPDASVLFGWCTDGHCDNCTYKFVSSLTDATYTCSHDCHKEAL